jgi:hypothetical protein
MKEKERKGLGWYSTREIDGWRSRVPKSTSLHFSKCALSTQREQTQQGLSW